MILYICFFLECSYIPLLLHQSSLIIPKLLDFVNFCIKVESLGVVGYVAKHIQSSHLLKNTMTVGNIRGWKVQIVANL